eukprot:6473384-Amphidinium_carterae.1
MSREERTRRRAASAEPWQDRRQSGVRLKEAEGIEEKATQRGQVDDTCQEPSTGTKLKQLVDFIEVWAEQKTLLNAVVVELSRPGPEPLWEVASRNKGQLFWSVPGRDIYSEEPRHGYLGMALAGGICTLQQDQDEDTQ